MNQVIESLKNHRSHRTYTTQDIPSSYIEEIVESAQAAPSWIHGQQVSIVSVKDHKRKQKLSELCGGQTHIASAPVFLVFCMDFSRAQIASEMEKGDFSSVEDVDVLLVGATDVGLALGNAIAAAESLGLGIVPIGGVRRESLEVIRFLELPKYVVPIAGLCLGYPEGDVAQKPRLPKEAAYHLETYKSQDEDTLKAYNETMSSFAPTLWTKRVSTFYDKPYYSNIARMLKQQGFTARNMSEEA
ncbi:NADPH-dependent oxidoreductase [Shouchella shacheensis]|uniref:NADPH-dependent oxidoreductase n=1 Tax=Shouchella shacheensis TaxID=1649580 RepID=UPI000740026A|nr:NADPH-dependent oxidoreductase [Shouchella shacheensis]